MKKLMILAGCALMSAVAFAGPPERGGMNRMTEALQLDEAQAAEVQSILSSAREQKRAIRDGNAADRKDQMRALHEDTRLQLGAVLSEEQLAQFDALHEERMERKKARKERRRAESEDDTA